MLIAGTGERYKKRKEMWPTNPTTPRCYHQYIFFPLNTMTHQKYKFWKVILNFNNSVLENWYKVILHYNKQYNQRNWVHKPKVLKFIKSFSDFPGGAVDKNPPANAGDTGSIPGLERSHMLRSN